MQARPLPAHAPGLLHARAHAYAREHLETLGYQLLTERYARGHGACDLIAGLDGRLLFVDVAAGRLALAAPTAPTPDRGRALRAAASAWLSEHPRPEPAEVRFDLIRVWLDRDGELVGTEHWPNAF